MELKPEKIEQEPTIEILKPNQWKEYREIMLRAYQTDPEAFGESHEQEQKKSDQEIMIRLSDVYNNTYVAKIGEKVVATASYALLMPKHVEHNARISSVFTDPDFRKRGISEKLLRRLLEDLHRNSKTSRVVLSVGSEREPARKIYEKLGFVQFGLAHKEMKVGERHIDQIHMELIFNDKL